MSKTKELPRTLLWLAGRTGSIPNLGQFTKKEVFSYAGGVFYMKPTVDLPLIFLFLYSQYTWKAWTLFLNVLLMQWVHPEILKEAVYTI